MRRKAVTILFTVTVMLLLSSAFAAGANATPAWTFGARELIGSESVAGGAIKSSLTIPGLTTTCDFSYGMTIFNESGKAKGKVNEMTLGNCASNSKACPVESAIAEKLPWPLHGVTIVSSNYVVFEGIKFTLLYGGEECVLNGAPVVVTGTAGGLYDNTTGTFTFSSASFSTTKTAVQALKTTIEWTGVFTTEALGPNKGQVLELR